MTLSLPRGLAGRQILLLRHASAEVAAPGQSDASRVLVEKGRRQARTVAAWCVRHEVRPRHLLSSPLPRALETAWLVAEGCRKAPAGMALPTTSPITPPTTPEPQIVPWLALMTPTAVALAGLATWLAEHADAGLPCLVGHEPDLSALVAALVGAPRPPLRVRKASLSCLEFEAPGRAQLLWSLPCAHMRG